MEILMYMLLGYLLYQAGSFYIFYRLCMKVVKDFENGNGQYPSTDNVKELEEVIGKEKVHELYTKYKESEGE